MALSQSALSELLEAFRTGDGVDMIRESVRTVLQELVEFEAAGVIGAERYERTEDRVTERNGTRPKLLATKAGDIELRIPKLRKGSYFPSILEPRRRIDQALYAVVMEAYVHGISTRSVDDLVVALGADSGISKSEVSRICEQLDESVGAFRTRPLDHIAFPYVYLDATYLHVRNKPGKGGQVVSMAVVVATGIAADGTPGGPRPRRRGQRGRDVLAQLPAQPQAARPGRGAAGHLRPALRAREGVEAVLPGRRAPAVPGPLRPQPARARPQDSRRHGRRGVPHDLRPTRPRGRQPAWDEVRDQLAASFPKVGPLMDEAKAEVLAFTALPEGPLAQDLVHQPTRASQQGDQAPQPRRGDLPQRRRRDPTGRRGPDRHARRMDRRRPPLPLRGVHGAAQRPRGYW